MNHRRAAFAVLAAVLATAGPVSAHPGFTEQSIPAETETLVQLRVPLERPAYHSKVVIELPSAITMTSCKASQNWTCVRTGPLPDKDAWVGVWTRYTGTDMVETFNFLLQTPATTATYTVKVEQTYTDGTVVKWDGAPGSARPAAVLTVAAKGSPVVTVAPGPSHGTRPTSPPTPSVSPTAAADGGTSGGGGTGLATALVLGASAALVGGGYWAFRRRQG